MFKEKYALVKTILLGYLSDYNAKSTALRGRQRVAVTKCYGEFLLYLKFLSILDQVCIAGCFYHHSPKRAI
jgi:hypothetical protein